MTPKSIRFAAIQWRNDHLEHCDKTCNVSLHDLWWMAKRAGADFTADEDARFQLSGKMNFQDRP